MYGKEERKQTKREFWTTFGRLMKPHLSSEGYASELDQL